MQKRWSVYREHTIPGEQPEGTFLYPFSRFYLIYLLGRIFNRISITMYVCLTHAHTHSECQPPAGQLLAAFPWFNMFFFVLNNGLCKCFITMIGRLLVSCLANSFYAAFLSCNRLLFVTDASEHVINVSYTHKQNGFCHALFTNLIATDKDIAVHR